MNDKSRELPWASGPGEILKHGLDLLRRDTDTNRRLAMISIDNAVELMMKTYLGLPKRVTALTISRKEYHDAAESFPALLDALEKYAADKIVGVDLGAIEWYHRLRNELYHQGNGLTVERDKIEIYAEFANILFKNLFGYELAAAPSEKTELLGDFMLAWGELERVLADEVVRRGLAPRRVLTAMQALQYFPKGEISGRDLQELAELRSVRNAAAHGQPEWRETLKPEMVTRIRRLTEHFLSTTPAA
ncbi:MAG TPA: hypothetical protein VLC46_13965 [Thermoanaerobaculia bacterium]|jgi:hypothetical protein|nr:hypothetical protein [Thermoanaerobaculia bacterium]